MSNKTTWFYVVLYLFAIVAANLLVARFGPSVTIINAFLFIGLDLTTRDGLHEAWGKNGLWWKMLLLIGAGSLISYALNSAAGQIALASFVAFAAAGVTDTIVYQALHKRAWMVKVNGSNVASAAVERIAFPTIAFSAFLPLIDLGQFAAKVGGGFMWAWIIGKFRVTRVETEPA